MSKSCTTIAPEEITFEWVIKDIMTYLELYGTSECSNNILFSSMFSPHKNGEGVQLALKFYNTSLRCFISWSHNYPSFLYQIQFRVMCRLYVMNDKKEQCQKIIITAYEHFREEENTNLRKMVYSDKYLEITTGFVNTLLNNTLIIGCDLITCQHPDYIDCTNLCKSPRSIVNQFKILLESENFSDFTFHVHNQEFKVHKFILMIRSPVFKAMFQTDMKEKNRAVITDIRPEIFKIMLEFIYTEKIEVNLTEDVLELLTAADKYNLKDLKAFCLQSAFKYLDMKNAFKILSLSEEHEDEELFTCIKNFIQVYKKEILNNIDFEDLKQNSSYRNVLF